MSRVDLHPEELLDRARSGTATKEELSRAKAHVTNCAACTIEQTLLTEIERSAAPQPHDDLVAARMRAFVARTLEKRAQARARLVPRRAPRKWAAFAFAATLLITTIGAAMMLREQRHKAAEQARTAAIAAAVPPPALPAQGLSGAAADPRSEDAKDEPEKTAGRASEGAPATRAAQRPPRAALKAERVKAVDGSAAELFARANLLRRRDEVSEAAAVYRELERSFPGSGEELLSRVVLGRLLLDRLGDASSALAEFENYLARAPQGSLREEALVGRAVALGRLGRVAEERNAWRALLDAYPRSTSAARARARLTAPASP